MRLTVNGEMREAPDSATIADLLASLEIEGARVAVERNREVHLAPHVPPEIRRVRMHLVQRSGPPLDTQPGLFFYFAREPREQ